MTGEYRPRAEFRDGYKKLSSEDFDPAFFISQRSRLNLNYEHKLFKTGFSLQDIRVWGQTKQLNKVDGLSSIHQAWGELIIYKQLSLKAGRQEIVLDDSRMFGNVGWAQQARSHDAAIFKYSGKKLNAQAGFAFNQADETLFNTVYGIDNYKFMQFLWANYKFKGFSLSGLYMNHGKEDLTTIAAINNPTNTGITTNMNQTAGIRIAAHPGGLGGNFAFYYQTGEAFNGQDLDANYIAADIFFKPIKKLKLVVGFERLSGTNTLDAAGATNNSFTPFYGTNHKFNGHMDYFYVGNHANSVGLQDIYATVNYKYKKAGFNLTWHMFSTAADFHNGTEVMDNALGNEFDFSCAYVVNKMANIKVGYSAMIGSETLEAIKETPNPKSVSSWGWVMLTFKPQFIKHTIEKKK
jgi:hypothetical protein